MGVYAEADNIFSETRFLCLTLKRVSVILYTDRTSQEAPQGAKNGGNTMTKVVRDTRAAAKIVKSFGGQDVDDYILISNYGIRFTLYGRKCDARFMANCYGVALNTWSVSFGGAPIEDENERAAIAGQCGAIEDALNGII